MSGAGMGTEVLQWHDASVSTPDSDITVLCWLEPGGEWFAGWWGGDGWFDAATGGALEGVTHWAEPAGPDLRRRPPLNDEQALELARKHLDRGLSWAPRITRCTDAEIKALIRAVEAAHGIGA